MKLGRLIKNLLQEKKLFGDVQAKLLVPGDNYSWVEVPIKQILVHKEKVIIQSRRPSQKSN